VVDKCPICGSEDVVGTGPLTVSGLRATITVQEGRQCTLCGHLQMMVPQTVLVMLYPPGVRYLTEARRARLLRRRRSRIGV
jgi:hypothetical protein